MNGEQKITPEHLSRKAIVYLRQSSDGQVKNNLESQQLQYALSGLATKLGFREVGIIDTDLGSSAAVAAKRREGFEQMLGAVALGQVGLILSRELSRLSRTDKDFCQLMELCQFFGTLVGDEETIYDVSRMDDQLVLGIKATISVVELKVLRLRLHQGKENKARRGELYPRLPPGYVWDATDKVVKDPNLRVQEAIGLVFAKFRETWSMRQTFKWFRDNDVELPVTKVQSGKQAIVFQVPRQSFVASVLRNPFYAGAYESDETAGAVRAGKGLLAGLLRCGRCGRKLYVRYWGKSGTSARYLCTGDFGADGGRYCLGFGGATVDRRFGDEIVRVLSPLGVRASVEALDRLGAQQDDRREALQRQLEQLEYDTARAFEQYNGVDPRNRLVASELERRWNGKLEELERTRASLAETDSHRQPVSAEERNALMAFGERFADAWNHPGCPIELKKQIVRSVIEEVLVNEDPPGKLAFIVHWKGGSHTAFEMVKASPKTVSRTAEADIEVIRKMAARYGDDAIARVLNKLGRQTGKGRPWSQVSVKTARRNHGIEGRMCSLDDPEVLTLQGAARYTATSDTTIKKLVDADVLPMRQVAPFAPWEIQRADLDSQRVRAILERLKQTGRLVVGDTSEQQAQFFQ